MGTKPTAIFSLAHKANFQLGHKIIEALVSIFFPIMQRHIKTTFEQEEERNRIEESFE